MTAMPLNTIDNAGPAIAGLTPEVLTVSTLLSMPAVWTAVVERELPAGVLFERFLIVLLTCALLAELVRRLGEGGGLGLTPLDAADGAGSAARAAAPRLRAERVDERFGSVFDAGPDTEIEEYAATDVPLALDGPLDGLGDLDAGLAGFGSVDDLGELAPLNLDADPLADPFADPFAGPFADPA